MPYEKLQPRQNDDQSGSDRTESKTNQNETENRVRTGRRSLLKRIGAAGAIAFGGFASQASAKPTGPLQKGASASYRVRKTRERASGKEKVEYTTTNEVVGHDGDRVLIAVERETSSETHVGRYSVPVRALRPTIPGSSDRTVDLSSDGVALRGSVRDGWFDSTTVEIEEEGFDPYELSVELLETSGGTPEKSGRAFWLLPSLISPADGVRAVSSGTDPTPSTTSTKQIGGPTSSDVSIQQSDAYYAYSELITKDNQSADLTVWTSRLTGVGYTTNSDFDGYTAYVTTTTPDGAWSLDQKSSGGSVVSSGQVHVSGESHFRGAFPWSCGGMVLPVQQWKGHAYHEHNIFSGYHSTYLRGKIETDYCTSGSQWSDWSENVFYNQSAPYVHGSEQEATWYIV